MSSWVSLARFGVTIIPEVLNTLSEAQLVGEIHIYFLAKSESRGNVFPLVFPPVQWVLLRVRIEFWHSAVYQKLTI